MNFNFNYIGQISTDRFISKCNKILDKHIPFKKVNKQQSTMKIKPWLTNGFLNSINTKQKIFKNFLKTKNQAHKTHLFNYFKFYRNVLTSLLRKSKDKYYKDFFNTHRTNSRKIWDGIKSIINTKANKSHSPDIINISGKQTSDQQLMAHSFNDFYSKIAAKTKSKIRKASCSPESFLHTPNDKSIFLRPSSTKEISDIIKNLNNHKSNGPASIPTNILKLISPTASEILSCIINMSFQTGIYPNCLKKSNITPVFLNWMSLTTAQSHIIKHKQNI